MDKYIELGDYTPHGEPTVQIVSRTLYGRSYIEDAGTKYASEAFDYVKSVTPREGRTVLLVNAMGASETYDQNRNGDAFPWKPYRVGEARTPCGHSQCQPKDTRGWVNEDEVLTKHFKTFETGGIFKHHVNGDIAKSLGKVEKAFWNDAMKRVELLLEVRNDLAPDVIEKVNSGILPSVSMGCRVRWDVCYICGHRAPTRKQYCEHALKMGYIDPATGMVYCVLNPSPHFFDISFVYRPADRTGFTLKKVAEHGHPYQLWDRASLSLSEKVASFNEKAAVVRKVSDIQKQIVGKVQAAKVGPESHYRKAMLTNLAVPPMPEKAMEVLAEYTLPVIVSTLAFKGAALTTSDLMRLYMRKIGAAPSAALLDRTVALQPFIIESLANYPYVADKLAAHVELAPKHVSLELAEKLAGIGDWLRHRSNISTEINDYGAPPRTDMLTMTDPNSGHMYSTTRGAALSADHEDMKGLLGMGAGLTGLYSAGLYGLARGVGLPKNNLTRAGAGLLGLGGAIYTAPKAMGLFSPYRNPQYVTDQGVPVSGGTEFKEASFSYRNLLDKLAADYIERTGADSEPQTKLAMATSGYAGRLTRSTLSEGEKVAMLFRDIEDPVTDATEPPNVSVAAYVRRLGEVVLT